MAYGPPQGAQSYNSPSGTFGKILGSTAVGLSGYAGIQMLKGNGMMGLSWLVKDKSITSGAYNFLKGTVSDRRTKFFNSMKYLLKGKSALANDNLAPRAFLKTLPKVLGGIGVGVSAFFAVKSAVTFGVKTARAAATITRYAPQFLEQKLAPVRNFLNQRPEFAGDTTGVGSAATERGRALRLIQQSHGIVQDNRFIGREARFYSSQIM